MAVSIFYCKDDLILDASVKRLDVTFMSHFGWAQYWAAVILWIRSDWKDDIWGKALEGMIFIGRIYD